MLVLQRSLIVFFVGVAILSGASASIAADRTGEQIYREACASCHGKSGEGTIESYPHPLVGERSVGELAVYISKTMPEDKPGTVVGEEARKV